MYAKLKYNEGLFVQGTTALSFEFFLMRNSFNLFLDMKLLKFNFCLILKNKFFQSIDVLTNSYDFILTFFRFICLLLLDEMLKFINEINVNRLSVYSI